MHKLQRQHLDLAREEAAGEGGRPKKTTGETTWIPKNEKDLFGR